MTKEQDYVAECFDRLPAILFKDITIHAIVSMVVYEYNATSQVKVSVSHVKELGNSRCFSDPRYMAMMILSYEPFRKRAGITLRDIGDYFSRNHSSVSAAWQSMPKLIAYDSKTKAIFNNVMTRLYSLGQVYQHESV